MVLLLAVGSWLLLREAPSHGAWAADSVHAGASADLRAPPATGPSSSTMPSVSRERTTIDVGSVDRGQTVVPALALASLKGSDSSAAPSPTDALDRRRANSPNSATAEPREASADSADHLVDRTGGGREVLIARIEADFLPLTDECIAQAKQRRPELAGDLVFGVELIVDEHGGVVERIEWQPENEVDDHELHECIEASALSMDLPRDDDGEPFVLHLRVE